MGTAAPAMAAASPVCAPTLCLRRRESHQPPDAVLRHRLPRRGHRPGARRHHPPTADQLPEDARLDPARGHRLFRRAEFPVGHQAGLRSDLRFRAAVRLSPHQLPAAGQRRRRPRLCRRRLVERAGRVRAVPAAHLLRHGDREHAVRRPAGRKRPHVPAKQPVRRAAVAVVLRRDHGERPGGRRAGRESVRLGSLESRRRHRCPGAARGRDRDAAVAHRSKEPGQPGNVSQHMVRHRRGIEVAPALAGGGLPVPLRLRARLRHAALLLHDRHAALLAVVYRRAGRGCVGRLDRRRPAASLADASHRRREPALSQHPAGHPVGGLVPAADRRGQRGDRRTSPTASPR